jgi:uncharacterized membrane protein
MEYPVLILLHVLFGILWAGGGITLGVFIVPSVLEAGPAGGAVMAGAVRRRMAVVLTMSAALVVLTGVRLFMLRFSTAWLGSPEGIVLTLGALLGLGAFALAVFVQRPAVTKLAAIAAEIARAGGPPTPAQTSTLRGLQQKLRRTAALTAWHLVGASVLMAGHRLAALW